MVKKGGSRRHRSAKRSRKNYGGNRRKSMRGKPHPFIIGGGMSPLGYAEVSGLGQGGAAGYETNLVGTNYTEQSVSVPKLLSGPDYAAIPSLNTSGQDGGQDGGQAGGRRRKKRRGGFLGQVISQAVAPFALLGANQVYGSRKMRNSYNRSRKIGRGGTSSKTGRSM